MHGGCDRPDRHLKQRIAAVALHTLDDGTFGVDVTAAGVLPTKVTGFASQEVANLWVANHKETVKGQRSPVSRVYFHRTFRRAPE
jgi:hypothetical protein